MAVEDRMQVIERVREFNRFYTDILGLLDQYILNSGFSLTEARILYELDTRGACIANTLCTQLRIDKSYLSRIINGFEKKELITKSVSQEDNRAYMIRLTPKGQGTMQELNQLSSDHIRQILLLLSDAQCDQIQAAMNEIQQSFVKAKRIKLRVYTDADIDFVVEQQIALYQAEYGLITPAWKAYVKSAVQRFHEKFDAEKDQMILLEYDGRNAGCIAITHTDDMVAQLRFFFLDSHIRGLGMGNRLMELALAFCRDKQYRHVFLVTSSMLLAARHLYRKYGFQLTESHQNNDWGDAMIEERWDLEL